MKTKGSYNIMSSQGCHLEYTLAWNKSHLGHYQYSCEVILKASLPSLPVTMKRSSSAAQWASFSGSRKTYITVQLHLDSNLGDTFILLSSISEMPTIRVFKASVFSLSLLLLGGFKSVSTCSAFCGFEVRLTVFLPRGSFISGSFSPNIVTVGREPSKRAGFPFSTAIVAAS